MPSVFINHINSAESGYLHYFNSSLIQGYLDPNKQYNVILSRFRIIYDFNSSEPIHLTFTQPFLDFVSFTLENNKLIGSINSVAPIKHIYNEFYFRIEIGQNDTKRNWTGEFEFQLDFVE